MEAAAAKLLVRSVCAGVGLALQVVHSSTYGFSAGIAVRPRVQFDVSGKYEEKGDDCRKGVPSKRKKGEKILLPGRSGGPCLWGACLSDCICSLGRRVVGVATERLQS